MACTFGQWFDKVLHERGLVVLRKDEWEEEECDGQYEDEYGKISNEFANAFYFSYNDSNLKLKLEGLVNVVMGLSL